MLRMEKLVSNCESAGEGATLAQGRTLATRALVVWLCAVTAGRLLAYTFRYLLYGQQG
jgi:hypothetical protein